MPLEKSSLVLLDYTARVKDTNEIFETTREEDAKKTDHYDPTRKYEPRLVSVGESWVLKGLDEALANANVGDKMNVEITPDKGFGDRDPGKVRMIPQRKLGEKADEVSVGDVIEVDDRTGIVRYVGSGRIQVDFNHRFAGKTLQYDVNVMKKLETDEDKITGLVKRRMGLDSTKVKTKLAAPDVEIELPEEAFLAEGLQVIKRAVTSDIFKFIPSVKNVRFVENYSRPEEQKKPEQQPQAMATAEATK
ncbi:MAG TPA: FKBP-type peptidyl-prolyl cis-trans isomerase [Nitrososphaera sp.]|jgi:peptidylprolyl isomerase|nr:FKBP-type peptidyl-prolyl cis-trans isomerase [Nitrososphaera sp.]